MSALLRAVSIMRLFAAIGAMLAIAAPIWLGPVLGPVGRALGAFEHICACGMKRGTCGCPTCVRLEHERLKEKAPGARPLLKPMCDDDDAAPPAPPLPPFVVPSRLAAVAPVSPTRSPSRVGSTFDSKEPDRPPTPPPRAST